jgi:general secretion pathway protein L
MTFLSPPANRAEQLVRRAFRWWSSELALLLPHRLLRLFGGTEEPKYVLRIGPSDVRFVAPDRGRLAPVAIPLTGYSDEEMRRRIAAVAEDGWGGAAVAIHLDERLLYRTRIELPLSAELSLRPILQHQVERLLPLEAADVSLAHRIISRSTTAATMTVEVTVAKRATIDRALATARSVGLTPAIALAAPSDDGRLRGSALVLWQSGNNAALSPTQRRLRRGLEAAALLLALAAYGLHVYRLDEQRAELQARVAEARPAASAAKELSKQVGEAEELVSFFRRRRAEMPPLLLLDQLTKLVPTDTWLDRFSMQGRVVTVTGYGPRATDLIRRFESSSLFQHPKFRSPITLAGSGERFDLSVEIAPEPSR